MGMSHVFLNSLWCGAPMWILIYPKCVNNRQSSGGLRCISIPLVFLSMSDKEFYV